MRPRTPPAAHLIRVCVVCGEPIAPRARATTTRCRVCTAKQSQADCLVRMAVNQRVDRHRPRSR
jgi:hypothetical protein